MAAKSFMSARKTVVLTTFVSELPAASRIARRFSITRSVCAATPPCTISPVAGSSGIWPAVNTRLPATMAWLYGPMASGARSVRMLRNPATAFSSRLGFRDSCVRRNRLALRLLVSADGGAQLVRGHCGDTRLADLDAGRVVGEHGGLRERGACGERHGDHGRDRVARAGDIVHRPGDRGHADVLAGFCGEHQAV